MSLDLGKMYASVVLDDGDFKSGLDRMQNTADSVFKKIGSLAAAYLSWRSIADVTAAFMTQQDAVEGVRSALRNLGRETDGNTAKFSRFASEMQKITKYGDESTLAVMSQGMRLGIDPSQIESVTKSAMGLSQKLGIDLPSSMQLLAKASQGHTEMLARYGLAVDENLSKEEQYQQILQQGADCFSLVTDAANTAHGKYVQMMNAIGDSKEVLGGIAMEILLPAANAVKEISTAFNNLDPAMQKLIVTAGTLGASLAALNGFGFLQKANDAIRNLAPTQYLLEAEKAAEAEKRAEYEKTDAMKERHAQAQLVRVTRIRRAEAQSQVMAAQAAVSNANPNDVAALTKAKGDLAAAEMNLTKAQIAESEATQGLADKHRAAMIASRQHAAAANVNAVAQKNAAASMTVSGRAALFCKNAFRAAGVAAKGLVASLGPIGIAMLAISGIVAASRYIYEKYNNEIDGSLNLAKQQSAQANETAEANRKAAEAETTQFNRLQELSRYERMNNEEKTEAKSLIDTLQKKYGDLGIQIDTVSGKVKIAAGAWDKLSAAQRKNARNDLLKQQQSAAALTAAMQNSVRSKLGSTWRNGIFNQTAVSGAQWLAPKLQKIGIKTNSFDTMERERYTALQNEFDDVLKLKTAEEQIAGFEKIRNKLLSDNKKTEADAVSELIKNMQQELALKKQLAGQTPEEKARKAAEKAAETAKKIREAQDALTSKEWSIKFNLSDPVEQIRMLDDRIKEIFALQSGKYANLDAFKSADRNAMSEQELKDLSAIVDLEEKRRAIRQQGTRTIEEMNRTDQQDAERRAQSMQEKLFARQLERLREDGQLDAARELLNREYAAAKEKAEMLEREYADAKAKAEADSQITEQENRLLAEARRKMQEAQQRQDSLEGRVYQENKKRDNDQKAAGSFSSAVLNAMLGAGSPEKETAKNTREMVRLQRQQLAQNTTETAETYA